MFVPKARRVKGGKCSLLSAQCCAVLDASRPGPAGALRAALTRLRAARVVFANSDQS